jgi:hypothetical protein
VSTLSESALGTPDRIALALPVMRSSVASLDDVFSSFQQDPGDAAACPDGLVSVQTHFAACRSAADSAGLAMVSRVVLRALAFVERLRRGQAVWSLTAKLALEELVTVVDMILDVVELVGTDSGCRQDERVSFRILASVAPQVLTEVDGMDFRQIRFHQAATGHHLQRTA